MAETYLTKTLALLLITTALQANTVLAEDVSATSTPVVSGEEVKTSRDLKQWGKAFQLEEDEFSFLESPSTDAQVAAMPTMDDPDSDAEPDEDPMTAALDLPTPRATGSAARARNEAFAFDRFADDDFAFEAEVAVGPDPGGDISTLPEPELEPELDELDELEMELAQDLDDLAGETE